MARAARIAAVCAAAALASLTAAPAHAEDVVRPTSMDRPPAGYRLTGRQAEAIADRTPTAIHARRSARGVYDNVFEKSGQRWQVSYYVTRGKATKEIAQIYVSDESGRVTEAWTGPQVAWTMARGYPGAFGRKVNSPLVWITLTLLFVIPFVDPRRPLRIRHLDLAVLMAFGVSVAFFNDANIDISVPLVYPLMLYLLARMLWIGLRRGRRRDPLRLLVPASWLVVGLLFLVGFRIGLNVADSNVIDVGYAGVIGADRLADGDKLWGAFPKDNEHGDTYGPVNYAAYVPFEQALPWSGRWDDLPAAHAASIAFDLLCLGLLFLIGRRMRGPTLGIALAYAWAANPFTLYAMDCNVNDALVGGLVLGAIAAASSPAGRGALVALAGMAKFAPLALAPLFATHTRGALRFALGGAAGARAVPAADPRLRRPARLLRPHAGLPDLARLAVLGLGPVRVGHGAGRGPGRGGASGGGRRLPAAPARPGRALRAGGCRARRAAARRHPLVLPLHRVVPRAAADRPAGRRRARRAPEPPSYVEQLGRLPAPAVAWR